MEISGNGNYLFQPPPWRSGSLAAPAVNRKVRLLTEDRSAVNRKVGGSNPPGGETF